MSALLSMDTNEARRDPEAETGKIAETYLLMTWLSLDSMVLSPNT